MSEQGNNNQNMENSENSENIIQHGGGCPTFGDFKVGGYLGGGGCGFDIWDEFKQRWWIDIDGTENQPGSITKASKQPPPLFGGGETKTLAAGVDATKPESLNKLFTKYRVKEDGPLWGSYAEAKAQLATISGTSQTAAFAFIQTGVDTANRRSGPQASAPPPPPTADLKTQWTGIAGNEGVVGELVTIDTTDYIYAGSDPKKPGNYRFVGLTTSSGATPGLETKTISDITAALTRANSGYKSVTTTTNSTFKQNAALVMAISPLFGYTEITGLDSTDPNAIGIYLADKSRNPNDYYYVGNDGTPIQKKSPPLIKWDSKSNTFGYDSQYRYFWRSGKGIMNVSRASLLSTADVVSAKNIEGGKYKAANIEALVTYTSQMITKGGSEKHKTKRRGKKAKNSTKRNY